MEQALEGAVEEAGIPDIMQARAHGTDTAGPIGINCTGV